MNVIISSKDEELNLLRTMRARVVALVVGNPFEDLQVREHNGWHFMKWTSCPCKYTDTSHLLHKMMYGWLNTALMVSSKFLKITKMVALLKAQA